MKRRTILALFLLSMLAWTIALLALLWLGAANPGLLEEYAKPEAAAR